MERQRGRAYDIDRKLIPALIACSFQGYVIDHERLEAAIASAESTRDRCAAQFDKLTEGVEVLQSRRKKTTKKFGVEYVEKFGPPTIGSPKQLQRYFDTDSTDDASLKDIERGDSGEHGAAAAFIRKYREASKLLTTYFYPNQEKETMTGLFNLTPQENDATGETEGGTQGGRLSSERANMQNQAPAMQRCLRAPKGWTLVNPDYSQIELRVAAEVSQDPYLLEVFKPGSDRDPHMETRDYFIPHLPGWCTCGPVKCAHRDQAKRFNFGVLYYGGPAYLSSVMGVRYEVGESLLLLFHQRWTGFFEWAERHWVEVQRTGKSTIPVPVLGVRNVPLVGNIEHSKKLSINHPIQGMAGYIMKDAMTRLHDEKFRLVNQIHDSAPLLIPDDVDPALQMKSIREIMEGTAREYLPSVGVPVDVKTSVYWRE
jgi:DNA polymerase I-like protein with 3'-5' exonuclease and polymerase domains